MLKCILEKSGVRCGLDQVVQDMVQWRADVYMEMNLPWFIKYEEILGHQNYCRFSQRRCVF
jgi:hypothetical protein